MVNTESDNESEHVRRVAYLCPFCNAERRSDDGVVVVYKCGSTASRAVDDGHEKKCNRILSIHWGPL